MEELLLVTGIVLAMAALTVMTRLSKQLERGNAVPSSKLRWIHFMDVSGRNLLSLGATLSVSALLLGLFEPSPHKLSVNLLIVGILMLALAVLIIMPTFFGRPLLIFGFKPLVQKSHSALKSALPTQAAIRSILWRLGTFCLLASKAIIALCGWVIIANIRDMEKNSTEENEYDQEKKLQEKIRQEDDYDFWYGRKNLFHYHND